MKKIKLTSSPFVLENKDFQTIQISIFFPFDEKEEDFAKIALLPGMLMYMNNEYPTEEEFQLFKKKNYILNIGCMQNTIGTTGAFSFTLTIPESKLLEKNYYEEQIRFFKEMIFNPKIIDNHFDEFEFEREKKNLFTHLNNALKNMRVYQNYKLKKLIDTDGILSRNIFDFKDQIDVLTNNDLYKFYLKYIKNNQYMIFVMGNTENTDIITLLNKHFNYSNGFDFNCKFNNFLKPRNENVNIFEEEKDFRDSSLSVVYKVENMCEDDFIYLDTITGLLSSLSSRLLSKKLRDENDLIYSHKINNYSRFGCFEITAYINKNNKDIVQEKIFEVINDLKDEKLIEPLLNNLKERKRLNLLRALDNKYLLFDDFIFKTLGISDTINENYEKLLKIKSSDIVKFIDRLKLDTIYFLKESDKNEE